MRTWFSPPNVLVKSSPFHARISNSARSIEQHTFPTYVRTLLRRSPWIEPLVFENSQHLTHYEFAPFHLKARSCVETAAVPVGTPALVLRTASPTWWGLARFRH